MTGAHTVCAHQPVHLHCLVAAVIVVTCVRLSASVPCCVDGSQLVALKNGRPKQSYMPGVLAHTADPDKARAVAPCAGRHVRSVAHAKDVEHHGPSQASLAHTTDPDKARVGSSCVPVSLWRRAGPYSIRPGSTWHTSSEWTSRRGGARARVAGPREPV